MANRIFLELPSADELKTYNKVALKALIKQLDQSLNTIDHEAYKGYCVRARLKEFYDYAKDIDRNLGALLLKLMSPWIDRLSPDNTRLGHDYEVDGSLLGDSLLAVYLDNQQDSLYTLLLPASVTPKHITVIENHAVFQQITPLTFEEESLYYWFVANRRPQRQLDKNYRKHSKFKAHMGKRGVISPWTYSDSVAEDLLRHAVYSKSNKRLLLYHRTDRKVLVFFNENIENAAIYHAYQISEKDKAEFSHFTNDSLKKMRRFPYE